MSKKSNIATGQLNITTSYVRKKRKVSKKTTLEKLQKEKCTHIYTHYFLCVWMRRVCVCGKKKESQIHIGQSNFTFTSEMGSWRMIRQILLIAWEFLVGMDGREEKKRKVPNNKTQLRVKSGKKRKYILLRQREAWLTGQLQLTYVILKYNGDYCIYVTVSMIFG